MLLSVSALAAGATATSDDSGPTAFSGELASGVEGSDRLFTDRFLDLCRGWLEPSARKQLEN